MSETFGVQLIATALNLTVPQIQQWMVRGFLTPEGPEGSGRRPRQWTTRDVLRVQVCCQLVGSRIRTPEYHKVIEAAVSAPKDCLLIITPIGRVDAYTGLQGHFVENLLMDEKVTWRLAPAGEIAKMITSGHSFREMTIIDLGALAKEAREAIAFVQDAGGKASKLTPPQAET